MASSPRTPLPRAAFRAGWAQVQPLIIDEWPGLDADALAETDGDAEAVVSLIAAHTERTKVLTRRLLAELLAIATEPEPQPEPQPEPPRRTARRKPAPDEAWPTEPLDRLVRNLEEHLDDIARQVKQDVTPLAVDTARQHIGLALLLAGGIGLMIGLFLGALGYPQAEVPDVDA